MTDPLIGKHLGNYRIDSVIGRGGMATVYYGFDESLHRPVAVKVIDARYRENPAYAERFLQEARAVATWRHDNILQVFYAGQEDDLYYFAMEYVDGPDLSQVMKEYAAEGELMPHEDVLKIGRAVASALDYAHSQEIIHRDVKPSNVMVAKDGRISLADFGLALNAQMGSMGGTFGTPHYIAPEQARNSAQAVPQSDIYALGVMLYEMLTGSVPFDDPSPTSLAVQHLTQPPPPPRQLNPRLNEATETVLLKALSKQPEERYQTGAELMEALAAALAGPDTSVTDMPLPPLPSGVAPAVSQTTVMDRVSLYMPPPPPGTGTTPAMPPSTAPATPSSRPPLPPVRTALPPEKGFPLRWVVVVVVIVLALGVGWILFGRGDEEAPAVEISPTTAVAEAGLPATEPAAETLPPTAEATAQETAVPAPTESEATATAVETEPTPLIPSLTPSPVPPSPTPSTTPAAPSATAVQAAPTATPTGTRLVMFYDATSFYLYNPNADTSVRVSQLVFESLDENGNQSGYWFDGRRWSQFYSFVEPFSCVRLEMTRVSGWLRPSQCRDTNATITPEQEDDMIFWTARPGVAQFRVLWQEQEIGRCDAAAAQCEVYLP